MEPDEPDWGLREKSRQEKGDCGGVMVAYYPMHYRSKPIKEVQFGFAHFVSHFIRVQIFQIDFPLILSL